MHKVFINLLICLVGFILFSCSREELIEVTVGNKSPYFSLKTLDGNKITSQTYDGDLVVINFWATWCQNCKKELPILKALADKTKAKVIGIALDEGGIPAIKAFIQKNGINYTVLLGNERTFSRFRGLAIPYTLLLDRSQHIVEIYRGAIPEGALEAAVKKIS